MPQPQMEKAARTICDIHGFTFVEFRSEGTFKETFHIRNIDDIDMALKICRPSLAPERTQREIDAMLRCAHPNIARLISVFQDSVEGQNYFVMLEEYLSGGTLTDRLKLGLMSRQELLTLGTYLISAVSKVSENDLVHRDIKPDNVMFREDATIPVLLDFGIVRDLSNDSLTQTWQMRGPGSAYYASPEQLNNDKLLIDWRTDQYALGVLFSICLFGFHPYSEDGDSMHQTIDKVAQHSGPSTRFIATAESAQMQVLKQMVAPWPAGRIRTTNDLNNAWPRA